MSSLLQEVVSKIEVHTGVAAKWSTGKARVASPLRPTNDRNLLLADGKNRLRITDFSHGCDPKDILEAIGMSLADVYYEPLTPSQKRENRSAKSNCQIEEECLHAYFVLNQLPQMQAESTVYSPVDIEAVKQALTVIESHGFTDEDYLRLVADKQSRADEYRLTQCEQALDHAYERFLNRGARYAE